MASCMLCKKEVTSGLVVCGDCAHKLEPSTPSAELVYFIDKLAESITSNQDIYPCNMCSNRKCSPHTSGMTCQEGVKSWLLSKAGQYLFQEPCAPQNKTTG